MTDITLEKLSRMYPGAPGPAVDTLSLEIGARELLAILGPSGCGKTTILKMIAGLQPVTSGEVRFNGRLMNGIKPEHREAVMVYQNHLLFPYMDIAGNVGFGLKMRHVEKGEIRRRVSEMLALVRLEGFERRRPHQLSGGERQRAALARALVIRPKVLLLDEPLSNLDAALREEMRELILRIHGSFDVTTLFVTHDQTEAVLLADRIALVFEGRLQQTGPGRDFYERPVSSKVAAFFGNRNCISGSLRGGRVETEAGIFEIGQDTEAAGVPDGNVKLLVRPESVHMGEEKVNSFRALIRGKQYMGTYTRYKIRMGRDDWEVHGSPYGQPGYEEGIMGVFSLPPGKIRLTRE